MIQLLLPTLLVKLAPADARIKALPGWNAPLPSAMFVRPLCLFEALLIFSTFPDAETFAPRDSVREPYLRLCGTE